MDPASEATAWNYIGKLCILGFVTTVSEPALGAELLSVVARLNRWATHHAALPVSPAQARLLAQIEDLGSARIGELARADQCSQPTMTSQVQRLEELRWVSRVSDPADARAVLISLTPEGGRLLDEVRVSRAAVIAPVIQRLDADQKRRLKETLSMLSEMLAAVSAAPALDVDSRSPAAADPTAIAAAGASFAAASLGDVPERD